jgi:aspartyl-tRNA(Asn)/glutamyl-tRNA(Gln) amidotransferase subunit C
MPEETVQTDAIDVAYVARLARLHLTPDETAQFQSQLGHVLDYVRKIREKDLSQVEPTAHPVDFANVFRTDRETPGLDHGTVMNNAPAVVEEQFMVPKIVE